MKKYRFEIDEPWDFKSEQGTKWVDGEIVREIDNKNVIFKSDEILFEKNIKGKILILSTRYVEGKIKDRDKRDGVIVGAGIITTNNYLDKSAEELKHPENCIYAFIGCLKRKPWF